MEETRRSVRLGERAPNTPQLLLGSLSSYPFEQHNFERNADFAKAQSFHYPEQAAGVEETRGPLTWTDRDANPRYRDKENSPALGTLGLAADEEAVGADAMAKERLRRRQVDVVKYRQASNEREYALQREILRFRVAFREELPAGVSELEQHRWRSAILLFHVEDGTVRVFEPKQDNSGLPSGDLLHRHIPTLTLNAPDRSAGSGCRCSSCGRPACECGPGARAPADRPEPEERDLKLADILGIEAGGADAAEALRSARLGAHLTLYGRTFVVLDADVHTRGWLRGELGIGVGPGLRAPASYRPPASARQHDRLRPTSVSSHGGRFENNGALGFYSRRTDRRGQFQAHSGQVLRFEGVWDNSRAEFGDVTTLAVLFYLEDDSLEVTVPSGRNSGREDLKKLLARQRVPRIAVEEPEESDTACAAAGAAGGRGEASRRRVGFLTSAEAQREAAMEAQRRRGGLRYRHSEGSWNGTFVSPITGQPICRAASGGAVPASALAAARSGHPTPPVTHVTPELLRCGKVLNLFGRRILLVRPDPFTQRWYKANLDLDQSALARAAGLDATGRRAIRGPGGDRSQTKAEPVRPAVPPHRGILAIGDEEETRLNASKLAPVHRASKDAERAYQDGGKVLRFLAKLRSREGDEVTPLRRFVVQFFLEDGSLSIFEKAPSWGGFSGGKFLERGVYRRRVDGADDAGVAGGVGQAHRAGARGHIYGYEHGCGQGYAGGVLGRQDRVGAGATGVAAAQGVGAEDVSARPEAPTAPVRPRDLRVGRTLELDHAPGQVFELVEADEFTRRMVQADQGGEAEGDRSEEEGASLEVADEPLERVAAAASGAIKSLRQRLRAAAFLRRAYLAPREGVIRAFAASGIAPPLVSAADVAEVLSKHVSEDPGRPAHSFSSYRHTYSPDTGKRAPSQTVTGILWEPLVAELEQAQRRLSSSERGTPAGRAEQVVHQLRSALLTSREHLRRVFRDVGVAVPGGITQAEFTRMLRRHHLDMGMRPADIAALMRLLPQAPLPQRAGGGPLLSIDGLVAKVCQGTGMPPAAVADVQRVVRGIGERLPRGAGPAPEVYAHRPRPAAWGAAPGASAASGPMAWLATKLKAEGASRMSPEQLEALARHSAEPQPGLGRQSGDDEDEDYRVGEQEPQEEAEEDMPAPEVEAGPRRCRRCSDRPPATEAMETGAAAAAAGPAAGASRQAVLDGLGRFFQRRLWQLRRTFILYDRSGSGSIARTSFLHALNSAGYPLTPEEAAAILPVDPTIILTGKQSMVEWEPLVQAIHAAARRQGQ